MFNFKKFILKNKWVFIGAVVGAIGGFLYSTLVGCATGTCAITSNPYVSTVYFAIMGGLLVSILLPKGEREAREDK